MFFKSVYFMTEDSSLATLITDAFRSLCPVERLNDEAGFFNLADRESALFILDYDLKNPEALSLFKRLRVLNPLQRVILLLGVSNIEAAVLAAKLGISKVLGKPVQGENLRQAAVELFTSRDLIQINFLAAQTKVPWLAGSSAAIREFNQEIYRISQNFSNLALLSERGYPLLDIARLIHDNGFNREREMIELNLESFQKASLEAHFWTTLKELLLENSSQNCGTIFLEGFESVSPVFQAGLLEYLKQTKSILFAGKIDKTIRIIIPVFDQQAWLKSEQGKLPADFFQIRLPSLKERKEDLPLLLRIYLKAACLKFGKNILGVDPGLIEFMQLFDFCGNLEELRMLIEETVFRAEGDIILLKDLPLNLEEIKKLAAEKILARGDLKYAQAQAEFEKQLLFFVLSKAGGSQEKAARFLDLPKSLLAEKVKDLGALGE